MNASVTQLSRAICHLCVLALALGGATICTGKEAKHVLMIAGKPSHGYGSHEHYAGLKLISETLEGSDVNLRTTVTRGWPTDESLLSSADAIVIYSDGGGGHPAIPHREELRALLAKGKGFVCLHYATEVPKGDVGDDWIELLGGNFETDWSVNPHWVAKFDSLPSHPVTRGVKPFAINDEWYFHLRFAAAPAKVTPILQAVAPEDTMRRPDGPHSGNPHVRKSVAAGDLQTVAWTLDRPDGGRSFGFTGGHHHWNWGNESMLRLVSNAIVWSAGVEVPDQGVRMQSPGVEKLLENQDYDPPKNFSPESIAKEFNLSAATKSPGSGRSTAKPRLLYVTPLVTTETSRHRVDIDIELKGSRELYLVVSDGGDGYDCDWANWMEPILYRNDKQMSLLDLAWEDASTGWGKVGKNVNANGEPLSFRNEKGPSVGIGVHANSVVHYKVPEGFTNLRVTAGLDSGGTNQKNGKASSVRFAIYADAMPDLDSIEAGQSEASRSPDQAVAGLEVAADLEVTLAASEPELSSLTNLDIDDRGRVWVCDVMNYRKNDGSRPEGDKILILEDTNGDGVMDTSKVFYQGNDINSAMGICVLGKDVIVSAAPYIWKFTDEDGDDVADKKVAMFTETGQPQHDHSSHSFLFGPDGKLYWNFGNTGLHVKDANGKVVVDIHGREVIDNGKPFFGGMPFRCNLDGSEFEVLAHNFRNNWETTVDSFGSLWQSDNDDDGNRGTRINFVMEHGNYGYRDEMTGATWQTDRINMEKEIPLKHWHLNDPGVVPNVLQTGAGSPSGICLYEGSLLPKRFHNQMIHCDPGPNMVRAYPVTADGAGYKATIEPMMTGLTDKWFRPADVCVAPDGSLFVTDWYDPGVGGHRQEDVNRGRLFRIAPPGVPYKVPKFDYSTVEGVIEALQNPALAVRFKAWMALHAMGTKAEAGLQKLYANENPRLRARALWLLGKIDGRGEHYVRQGLLDSDADIRITAIRLSRQLKLVPSEILSVISDDPSPAVRREALVALRFDNGPKMPQLWAKLASHYDSDRWYLEALGIASDVRAKECFDAFVAGQPIDLNNAQTRDILWRLRTPEAADAIAKIIVEQSVALEDTDRFFRALEFHPSDVRTRVLRDKILNPRFASMSSSAAQTKNDAVIVRALERVELKDQPIDPVVQAAVDRYIASRRGTPEYLKLVKRFAPKGAESALSDLALQTGDDSASVEALRLLMLGREGATNVRKVIADNSGEGAKRITYLLGLLGNDRCINLLKEIVQNAEQIYELRSEAIRAMAKNNLGGEAILSLAAAGTLPGDTSLLAGGLLARSENQTIRSRAQELLPLPAQMDSKPMPSVDELAKMGGDANRGEKLFKSVATCSNCHIVNGFGKQVGPDLSEIGTKLPREAMYTAILAPNAGISHNYENFIVLLESGQVISGLKVSETESQVTIRTAEAVDRVLDQDDIVDIKQSEKSIMPENLHHTVDQQGLVDIVEYMTKLTKAQLAGN